MGYAGFAQPGQKIGREEHLLAVNKTRRVSQEAGRMPKTLLHFLRSPVVFMVDFTDQLIVEARAGGNHSIDPFGSAMPLQVRGTRERGPLLAAALGKGGAFPLAQSRCTERGEQVAHVPVVIIAASLLKGVHIFEDNEGVAVVLAPMQAMYGAR